MRRRTFVVSFESITPAQAGTLGRKARQKERQIAQKICSRLYVWWICGGPFLFQHDDQLSHRKRFRPTAVD